MTATKPTFSVALQELEAINRWFQDEEIDLEEALTKLKRGKELIDQCQERLKTVENEFVKIKAEFAQTETAAPAKKSAPAPSTFAEDDLPF